MPDTMRAALLTTWLVLLAADRASAGVAPLQPHDPALTAVAQYRASALAAQQRLDHAGWDALPAFWLPLLPGFRGENLGRCEDCGPDAIEAALRASDEHAATLADPRFTRVGVALAVDDVGRRYWAQEFGGGA